MQLYYIAIKNRENEIEYTYTTTPPKIGADFWRRGTLYTITGYMPVNV